MEAHCHMNTDRWPGHECSCKVTESQKISQSLTESFEDLLDTLQDAEETTRWIQRGIGSVLAYAENTLNR